MPKMHSILNDVGKSPQEALKKGGMDGLSVIVGFWMFSHANVGYFYGSIGKAVREIWGEDATLAKFEMNGIFHRLQDNRFKMDAGGWRVPDTWSWQDQLLPRQKEEIKMPPPGPVTKGWLCTEHNERFTSAILWAQHKASKHPHKAGAKRILEAVRKYDGLTVKGIADHLGTSVVTIEHSMTILARKGALVRERKGHGYVYHIRGRRPTKREKEEERVEAPVEAPPRRTTDPVPPLHSELILKMGGKTYIGTFTPGRKVGNTLLIEFEGEEL